MENILDLLNSVPLYLICGAIILFVVAFRIIFLVRAYRMGIAIGMDKTILKRTITSSVTFSVLPSVSILLGVIALSGTLGQPSALAAFSGPLWITTIPGVPSPAPVASL